MNILKRLLTPRTPQVERKTPVLPETIQSASPPDMILEIKARALQRELDRGNERLDASAAVVRRSMAVSALRQMDRSR